jgi:hypothetical protein
MKHGIDNAVTILPVELVSFSGKKRGNANVLNWETMSELNTHNFELQRLNKDNHFETVATIKAQNKAAKYSFADDLTGDKTGDKTSARFVTSPTFNGAPIDYYRLKINDFDGKTTFSKTISLENDKILRGVNIYPNPASDVLVIDNAAGKTVEIVTILGQKVASFSPLNNHFSAPINDLKSGIYFVKIDNAWVQFIKN